LGAASFSRRRSTRSLILSAFTLSFWSDAPWLDCTSRIGDSVIFLPENDTFSDTSFALALAEAEEAIVTNELPDWLIEYPADARKAQEEFWADWHTKVGGATGREGT
jgi:hypothetical protein